MLKIIFHLLVTTLLFSHASLSDGLVAHYEFEGNANDSSGNDNNGTKHGGVDWVDGVIGQAGSFDGVDDYIEINKNLIESEGTISIWYYNDTGKENPLLGYLYDTDGNRFYYYNGIDGNDRFGFNNGGDSSFTDNNVWKYKEWINLTVVYNLKYKLAIVYINGIKLETIYTNTVSDETDYSKLFIGKRFEATGNGNEAFRGYIDDFRIYNRSLNESEIEELYKLGQPQEINLKNGLVAHYEFEGNANDSSGNDNNGTEHGGVSYVDGIIGQAGSFDGVDDYIKVPNNEKLNQSKEITISTFFITNDTANENGSSGIIITKGKYNTSGENLRQYAFGVHYGNGSNINNLYFSTFVNENWNHNYASWNINNEIGKVHHLVGIYRDSQISELWLDGVKVKENTFSEGNINIPLSPEDLYIGAGKDAHDNFVSKFNGLIDDLRIYNRALNQSEIKALYLKGISDEVTEENSLNLYETPFVDLTKEANFSYAILGQSMYTSVDEVKFVQSATASVALHAISSTHSYVVAVGDGGKLLWQQGSTSNEVTLGNQKLLDVANDGTKFVVVGEAGVVYVFEPFAEGVTQGTTGTVANIVAVTYDEGSSKYYAVSDEGEFLSSSDGLNWSIKTVDDSVVFTSLEVHGNIVLLVANGGTVYTSTDLGESFTKAVSNISSDILDVWVVGDLFVASTSTGLYLSADGINWLPDSRDFGDEEIIGLYEYDDILYVLTLEGARSLSGFQNIATGDTTKATVAKVDIEFETSTMTFNNGELETFNITPNDTMWIKHKGKNVAKLILGDDVSFKQYSENNSTLEKFLFKHEEYVEILGESTLYYNIGDDVYKPVSKGAFWLRDGKVYEKPLFTRLSDDGEVELDVKIDAYISNTYIEKYNNATEDEKKDMLSPESMRVVIKGMLFFFSKVLSPVLEEYHITGNDLLLGKVGKKFSPSSMTIPFFREMYLDVKKEKISLKDAYTLLPNFSLAVIQSILSLKNEKMKLPKVEFSVDGQKIKGSVNDLAMNLGIFQVNSKSVEVTSSLSDSNTSEELLMKDASLLLQTWIYLEKEMQTNISRGSIGAKAVELKLAYTPRTGYQLVSGEAGGEFKIPDLRLSPSWTLKDMTTYINIKLREEDSGATQVYDDKYNDDLGEMLLLFGTQGKLVKGNIHSKSNFEFGGKVDLMYGVESFSSSSDDLHNLYFASVSSKFSRFPSGGVFGVSGLNGSYAYNKFGAGYWTLGGYFQFFSIPKVKKASLFTGNAELVTDSNLDNMGLSINSLQTKMTGTSYYVDWLGNGGACLWYGKSIKSNFPLTCPNITDCLGDDYGLLPSGDETYSGAGFGAETSFTLKKGSKTLDLAGIKFEDMLIGSIGSKIFEIQDKDKNEVAIDIQYKAEVKLPKVDWKWLPKSVRDGKSLGKACLVFGTFKVSEEYSEWFEDKTENLGEHFGIYVKLKDYKIFFPLDKLTDRDGNQVLYTTSLNVKQTTIKGSAQQSKAYAKKVGDILTDTFSVNSEESVIIDLESTNIEVEITTPSGTVITQNTLDTEDIKVFKTEGEYVEIMISNPENGSYSMAYTHTGDEKITIFGGNAKPEGNVSLSSGVVNIDVEDAEDDNITYSLALIDEDGKPVYYIKEDEVVVSGNYKEDIPTLSHLKTGDYGVALYYKDPYSPMQKVISLETVYLEKSVDIITGLNIVATNEFTQVDWNIQSGVRGYNVALSSDSGDLLYEYNITSTQYTFDNLLEGSYSVSVYAYDETGLKGRSVTQAFSVTSQTVATRPSVVQNISIGTFGVNAVLLDWADILDADYYEINIYKDGERKVNNFVTSVSEYSLSSDFFAQQIKITIVAKNSANNGSEEFTQELYILDSTDSDADGMPDMWETHYFGHLLYSGDEDYDGDSLINMDEYNAYTNPSSRDSDNDKIDDNLDPNPNLNEDKNSNYVADDWESFYAIDDILADSDGDGYVNYIEYMVGMNPNEADDAGLDVSAYEARDYAPVLVSNIEDVMIISKDTDLYIDLSGSYDINGNALVYEWIVNASKSDEQSSQLTVDTSVCGMQRVEVNVNDGKTTRYKKFSIFVSDAQAQKVYGGIANTIVLDKYELDIPKASMKDNSFLVASDISQNEIPVDIMGRQIISDGMAYFYSDASKLESFITITPYIKDTEEIDPYIFNYDTSIWTNLVTGETFDPIFGKTALEDNDDKSYTLQTRETGILIFAKKPIVQVLTNVMNLDLENEIYSIDLNRFKAENDLKSVEHVTVSNQDVLHAYLGNVNGQENLQLNLLSVGVVELSIIAINTSNERVSYSYIINVERDLDGDGISDIYDSDIDGDGIENEQDAFPLDINEWLDTDADGIGNNADSDDDNDGISDVDEIANNLNPLDPTDADADFDGDGVSNRDEISAGTDPHRRETIIVPILYML